MSMKKRIFALLLTVAMLICVLASCSTPLAAMQTGNTSPSNATTSAKNGMGSPLGERKITSVHITSGDSVIERYAATELAWYLTKKNITLADDGYGIAILLDASLAEGGYQITADENGLTLAGGNDRGLAYGLYAFLENVVGIHFYSANVTVVEETDVMIGNGVLDEFDPAFEITRNPWHPIEQLAEKNGGNVRSRENVKTFALNALVGSDAALPCLSAAENTGKAIKKIQDYLLSGAEADVLQFVPDAYTACTCEDCNQILAEENCISSIYVRFLNTLKEAIAPRFPNVQIELVIQDYLMDAPQNIALESGIAVRFSTEQCHISHPITDANCPETLAFAQSVREWSTVCDNVCVDYVLTATKDYIPTFANLGSLRQNIRFFAECGIESIGFSGNFSCPSGEFGELRVYLISKLLLDPMMSEEEYYAHMNTFLKDYYGDGWEYIRMYIDKTVELAADGHQIASGNPFDAITMDEYLANEESFDEWWNAAEALAGERIDFVKRARYQWRYIKLCLHPNAEEAQQLIADASDSFMTRVGWREKQWNVDTARSDLSKSPLEWVYKS